MPILMSWNRSPDEGHRNRRNKLHFWMLFFLCITLSSCDSVQEDVIEVIEYRGAPITEANTREKWQVEVTNEVVVITSRRDSIIAHQITFFNIPGNSLPISPSYRIDIDTPDEMSLLRGEIAIQDWDVDGVMSGMITGDFIKKGASFPNGAKANIAFWVDGNHQ